MRISTSAQKRVNQICSIEQCSNAIMFEACGAEVELKGGGYSRLLSHHPRHLSSRVERVGVDDFWLAPHNLQQDPMALVYLVAYSFLSDEG